MATQTLSRDDVIDIIISVFRDEGYEGTSLAKLSKATGLGRSSLYHYFPSGKEDMAIAALDRLHSLVKEQVLTPLSGPGTLRERLNDFAATLTVFYKEGHKPCMLDVFSVGEACSAFQSHLRRGHLAFIQALAAVAAEAGASPAEAARRGEDAMIAIEGALVVSRGLGSSDPFQRIMAELPDHILSKSKI